MLPGNAGRELRFQRTWNSKGGPPRWTFGIAGVAMRVLDPGWAPVDAVLLDQWTWTPTVITADGASRRATWMDTPDLSSIASIRATMRWVSTAEFWRYDRELGQMYLPDGTVCQYDSQGRLTEVTDVFGNIVAVEWHDAGVTVRQRFGSAPPREVLLEGMDAAAMRPTALRYEGRTWTYEWGAAVDRAIPPVGPGWEYTRETDISSDAAGQLIQVRTPGGGTITYSYARQTFDTGPSRTDSTVVLATRVVRRTDVPLDTAPDTWTYTYRSVLPSGTALETVVETPVGTRVTYRHAPVDDPAALVGSHLALVERVVEEQVERVWTRLESEGHEYVSVPVIERRSATGVGRTFDTPRLSRRTLVRNDRSYETRYQYHAENYGDYGHPWRITETGESGATSRETVIDYAHLAPGGRQVIAARRTMERVTAGGETFVRSWAPDPETGFVRESAVYGVTTRFEHDPFGNVAAVTDAHGHTTAMTYEWGALRSIQTAAHTTTRSINRLDSTVASELQGGRTTTFEYDSLSRLRVTTPPGGTHPIVTTYDESSGAWVSTGRGNSGVTTTFDGFGRAVGALNSVGVRTSRRHDAEGRVVYESYPFEGSADIGTVIAYDGLGRVTRRTHPDGSFTTYTYGPGRVTVRDEQGRETIQRFEAFGDPDEARLVGVTDADGQAWTYRYNGIGKLTDVVAPDGTTRTWRYRRLGDAFGTDRLETETHPESGRTAYDHDVAGTLSLKTDANGTVFAYVYDANDRLHAITAGDSVTEIEYEPGTDDRRAMRLDEVTTVFEYAPATGRLASRTDVVNGTSFRVGFTYDDNDRVRALTYPSGRRVGYDYDAEGRITCVFDDTASGRNYATSFTYHPSGAVAAYTTGNGVAHTLTYDLQRYWPRSIAAGASMHLSYEDYDRTGNVHTIRDNRPGKTQTFAYDRLDRLEWADSPDWSLQYRYDVHGNHTTTAATAYAYWPGTLRLHTQTSGGVTREFTYDHNGNMRTAGGTTYTYTPFNMLASAAGAGIDAAFLYDADQWRIRKTAGGVTTIYSRGLGNELLTEWTNPGTTPRTLRDYIYAGTKLLAIVEQR